ncbi:uncharacterized protein M437DRAFT_62210 [Aureobasidium melanogenum CBS 110374]|uniref:Uncharacterized protein n=1 Tax=Aureobasidium melanogenum (strain CBS 110374) TaxID=1043003 RepID=A0A074WZJ3_AURM1|nr:uncharacterized protein M437DRAFT_62210 [Aureobasidium melanogenum CBS 110374]KEQ67841.1 hypothetical protein M437DRAFT_62210 [Aureobasidium melanogenum CBS 110374]
MATCWMSNKTKPTLLRHVVALPRGPVSWNVYEYVKAAHEVRRVRQSLVTDYEALAERGDQNIGEYNDEQTLLCVDGGQKGGSIRTSREEAQEGHAAAGCDFRF